MIWNKNDNSDGLMMPLDPDDQPPAGQGPYQEQVRPPVAAKMPEKVAQGVFCTGAIVLEGPEEFVLDFVQGAARPPRVGARIILSPRVMGQFVNALRDNLRRYSEAFGSPREMPKPPQEHRRSIHEIYDDLKMTDDQLVGSYANTVMIGHTPAEFFMDFIARFFPAAAVAARIYMSAPQVPRMLETMAGSLAQYQQRRQKMPPPEPPPEQA